MASLNRVVVVGGTHGNEKTGVQLIHRLQNNPQELTRESFTAQTLLANEAAIARNCRYLEQDLNRCFTDELLSEAAANKEQALAQAINRQFGPKGPDSKTEWMIDLHTTTANMGITLVVQQHDPIALDMAHYVQQKLPEAVIFYENNTSAADPFLCSVARHGFLIEVGPIPQGLLRWEIFEQTRQALSHSLDFIERLDAGEIDLESPRAAEVFQFVEKLHLPRNTAGEISGMVHPDLQDKDYHQLKPGEPLFILDTGQTIPFDGPEPVHVAFVNEAAYYDQAYGLSIMRKRSLSWKD